MRSYVHDDHKTQQLFASIINRLSHGDGQGDLVVGLLKDVCGHFRFGSGLIYEIEPSGEFALKEHYSSYLPIPQVPPRIRLDEHLSKEDLTLLRRDNIFVIQPQLDPTYAHERLGRLFSANSLVVCPVLLEGGQLSALVAMLDRRRQILLTPEDVNTAETVLRLVSTHERFRLVQKNLSQAYKSLGSILDNLGVDVYVSDYETRDILFVNKSMAEPYGGRNAIVGQVCFEALSRGSLDHACDNCPHDRLLDDRGRPKGSCTWEQYRPRDDTWQRFYSSAFPWVDGRIAQLITSVDISDSKRNEEIINRQAYYDQLTQLPNRRKLYLDCDERLPELSQDGIHAWLLFFDLDNFKNVNDVLGHHAGDELLQQIARFFDNYPELHDRFYRLGGDEFILLLEGVSRKYVISLVDKLLIKSSRPWKLTAGSAVCRTSIGISRFPDDGLTVPELLHEADTALYQAKEAGKGRAFFTDGKYSRSIDALLKGLKSYRCRPARIKPAPKVKAKPTARDRAGARGRGRGKTLSRPSIKIK